MSETLTNYFALFTARPHSGTEMPARGDQIPHLHVDPVQAGRALLHGARTGRPQAIGTSGGCGSKNAMVSDRLSD